MSSRTDAEANKVLPSKAAFKTISRASATSVTSANPNELPEPASEEPVAVIARTRKGHGVEFMEKQPQAWHLGLLNDEQYADVVAEISARMELANG